MEEILGFKLKLTHEKNRDLLVGYVEDKIEKKDIHKRNVD